MYRPLTLIRRTLPLAPIDLTGADREIYEIYGATVRSMAGSASRFAAKPARAPSRPP